MSSSRTIPGKLSSLPVITVGIVLLLLGLLAGIPLLKTLGLVLLVVGVVLALLGSSGRAVGRRKHYW